ncbi:hypothetical protein DFH09DRAFT_595991 [Mycena vulgaris]|nr:hypothetical protein DFH09DRAFT_595991 [Mycena vulgaris]
MDSPLPPVPNELWLRIFSHIVDAKSLKAVVLTSRRFHNLGTEELLRTIVWKTREQTEQNLEYWKNHAHQSYIPTALTINLNNRWKTRILPSGHLVEADDWEAEEEDADPYPDALRHASLFRNLGSLSLSNGRIPDTFYYALVSLPQLTHLALVGCAIPDAPPHFPLSFPSFADATIAPAGVTVTDLSIRSVYRDGLTTLFTFLPRLRALTTDDTVSIPGHVLQQLRSLNLPAFDTMGAMHLQHMPNLLHLSVAGTVGREVPALTATLSLLESFSGPAMHIAGVLNGSPNLVTLRATTSVSKPRDAIVIIEKASSLALRTIELQLLEWNDEVLCAITHRLPACREIKLVFCFSQPSDDWLFNFGIQYLSRLPHLHTLELQAIPPARYHGRDDDSDSDDSTGLYPTASRRDFPEETPMAAVPPEEEACAEYLAVWTRYNKALRKVRFGDERVWTRQYVGGPWRVATVDGQD